MKKAKKSKPDFSKPKPQKTASDEQIFNENDDFNSSENDSFQKNEEISDSETGDEFGQKDENATEELKFFPDKSYINLPTDRKSVV